jgi:hypothetical protein
MTIWKGFGRKQLWSEVSWNVSGGVEENHEKTQSRQMISQLKF